jgi:hypothetical protein
MEKDITYGAHLLARWITAGFPPPVQESSYITLLSP